jgi:hypothetical protein
MSFAKQIVMGGLFFVLPVLLSACGGDAGETEKRKKIGSEAQEKFKEFQEKQKSGKK